jgi:hypothetical protein
MSGQAQLITWPAPAGTPASDTFGVQVRRTGEQAWTDLFVHKVPLASSPRWWPAAGRRRRAGLRRPARSPSGSVSVSLSELARRGGRSERSPDANSILAGAPTAIAIPTFDMPADFL